MYCRCDTDYSGHLYIIDNCKISICDMKNSSVSRPQSSSAIYCFINSASCLAAVSSFSFEALLWLNNAGAGRRVKIPMPAWPQTLIREKCWAYTLQPPGLPPRSLTEHWGSLRSISLTDRGEELNGPNWELGQWGTMTGISKETLIFSSTFSVLFMLVTAKGKCDITRVSREGNGEGKSVNR